jgi:hypothetical protein
MSSPYHLEVVGKDLLAAQPGSLPDDLEKFLWGLLEEIGKRWKFKAPSSGARSSWTEFVTLRCETKPSYLEEYRNAQKVVESLTATGSKDAIGDLFNHQAPKLDDKSTRIDHAKKLVIDEFLTVRIVAGGFREFGGKYKRAYNYNGFIRGTRYNRVMRVRAYQPEKFEPSQCGRRSWNKMKKDGLGH